MAKPKPVSVESVPEQPIAAVPEQSGPRRINLSDGSWVRIIPTIGLIAASSEGAEVDQNDERAVTRAWSKVVAALSEATIEAQFKNGRPLTAQPIEVAADIVNALNQIEDEDALPKRNGTP